MNILEGEDLCKKIVKSWVLKYSDKFKELPFSWGSKREFRSTDPYDEVRITSEKIIVNQEELTDDRWLIEYTRGLIFINWPINQNEDKIELDQKWDFTKLISVFLLPPKSIKDRTKQKYVNEWETLIHLPDNSQRKLDLHRIYNILHSHSRNTVLELLGEFLFKEYTPYSEKPFISQFHFSLFNALSHPFSYDEIDLIDKALKHQTIKIKDLSDLMPHYSQSKVYSLFLKIENLISNFIYPCRRILGLYKFYIFGYNNVQLEKLRRFTFFESEEEFVDETYNFVKSRISSNILSTFILSLAQINHRLQFIIVIPDRGRIRISPEMYNPDTKTYFSVQEAQTNVIDIQENQNLKEIEFQKLNYDEMRVFSHLLRLQDDNPINNYFEFTKSQTKQLIRSVKNKNAYYNILLTRKGADLKTVVGITYLTNKLDFNQIFTSLKDLEDPILFYNILEKMNKDLLNLETLKVLKSKSWPYLTFDFGIKLLAGDPDTFRIVALARISMDIIDLEYIKTIENFEIIGVQYFNQGSSQVIPLEYYESGDWKFPLVKLLEILD